VADGRLDYADSKIKLDLLVDPSFDSLAVLKELDELTMPGNEKDPAFEARKTALLKGNDVRMKALAGAMGRLGLLIGFLGDRPRSNGAFRAAFDIDRTNRDVWLQYAQTLTALGDDVAAKPVFDWLLTNPTDKVPPPDGSTPK